MHIKCGEQVRNDAHTILKAVLSSCGYGAITGHQIINFSASPADSRRVSGGSVLTHLVAWAHH